MSSQGTTNLNQIISRELFDDIPEETLEEDKLYPKSNVVNKVSALVLHSLSKQRKASDQTEKRIRQRQSKKEEVDRQRQLQRERLRTSLSHFEVKIEKYNQQLLFMVLQQQQQLLTLIQSAYPQIVNPKTYFETFVDNVTAMSSSGQFRLLFSQFKNERETIFNKHFMNLTKGADIVFLDRVRQDHKMENQQLQRNAEEIAKFIDSISKSSNEWITELLKLFESQSEELAKLFADHQERQMEIKMSVEEDKKEGGEQKERKEPLEHLRSLLLGHFSLHRNKEGMNVSIRERLVELLDDITPSELTFPPVESHLLISFFDNVVSKYEKNWRWDGTPDNWISNLGYDQWYIDSEDESDIYDFGKQKNPDEQFSYSWDKVILPAFEELLSFSVRLRECGHWFNSMIVQFHLAFFFCGAEEDWVKDHHHNEYHELLENLGNGILDCKDLCHHSHPQARLVFWKRWMRIHPSRSGGLT